MPHDDEVAGWIRAERARLGWNQAQLAEASGVSRATIALAETGERCSLETIRRLGAVLPCDEHTYARWLGYREPESAR